jgi:membrane fusion protein (multidrug efflux system)
MKYSLLSTPLLCLSLFALTACGGKGKQQQQQMPPPEVGVIQAQPQNAPLTSNLVGRLAPFRSADVRARVPGVLLKRTYEEGSDVHKGQLLFQIDPAPLKASLDSALANLAQVQATYTNNHIAAQRVRELAPKGYVSKADVDNAQAAERSAAAAVQQARASVQSARINLGYADVTSPIDGHAGQQQVTEGALVGQGDATLLTTVEQLDPLYVNFTLSASDFNQMRQAQNKGSITLSDQDKTPVKVALPDGSIYQQQGTLDFSDTKVDQSTGAISLRALLPNPQHALLPGQFVTLMADLGQQHGVFLIPQAAVQRDTTGAYAMVVGPDGKVVRKDIDADRAIGDHWVVTKGIAAGDQVIVSGLQQVKEGAPAKATPWTPGQKDAQVPAGKAPASGKGAAQGGKSANQQ